jgi:hypothetical protein
MTVAPDGGQPPKDDGAKSGGTPEEVAARNAEAENRNKLIATLEQSVDAERKEKARLAAENEALRRAQSPAAPTAGDTSREARLAKIKAFAEGTAVPGLDPDPTSAALLETMGELEMTQREIGYRRMFDRLKFENDDERREVEAAFDNNRNLYGTPEVARAAVREKKLEARLEAEAAKAAQLAEALRVAQAPNGTAPPTHYRSVSALELKAREITREELDQATAGMSSFERLAIEEQIDKGEIKVRG